MLKVCLRTAQILYQFGNLSRVGFGFSGPVQRLFESGGGDQFHRPRDFLDILNCLTAFYDRTGFGHGRSLLNECSVTGQQWTRLLKHAHRDHSVQPAAPTSAPDSFFNDAVKSTL